MNISEDIFILAIESSCDDTSCAVLKNNFVLSNVTANQTVHQQYGGVVPELASRDHQKNIIPVIDAALKNAKVKLAVLSAIAVTRGPGLNGSLLVGLSVAKSLSLALDLPLIEVNHMQGHILSHFILADVSESNVQNLVSVANKNETTERLNDSPKVPTFPFLCLTASGGHTQIIKVTNHLNFELLAQTEDDAVGEAFDKAAKILNLPYPGGPLIDKYAQTGNAQRFKFPFPKLKNHNYSFSGIKTSFLYFIQEQVARNHNFVSENLADICASYQNHLITYLLKNLEAVAVETNIKHIAIAGGVSANSELREQLKLMGIKNNWRTYISPFEYCTDNAAMIAITGYYKFLKKQFCGLEIIPLARYEI